MVISVRELLLFSYLPPEQKYAQARVNKLIADSNILYKNRFAGKTLAALIFNNIF